MKRRFVIAIGHSISILQSSVACSAVLLFACHAHTKKRSQVDDLLIVELCNKQSCNVLNIVNQRYFERKYKVNSSRYFKN